MSELKKKEEWVSLAKGVAILAVVIGHVATPMTKFIFAWHVPFFFFVSGFFISTELIGKTTFKDLRRLMIPFLLFTTLALIIEYLKRWLFHGYAFAAPTIQLSSELKGTYLWMDMSLMQHYGFVLWFLPALFWGRTITKLLLRYAQSPILTIPIAGALVFLLSRWSGNLPFALDQGLVAVFWVLAGYYGYKVFQLLTTIQISFLTVILLVATVIMPIPYLNIATRYLPSPFYNMFYSLVLCSLICLGSKLLTGWLPTKILINWGEQTLTILIIHPYLNNIGFVLAAKFAPSEQWLVTVIISLVLINTSLILIQKYWPRLQNKYAIKTI